MPHTQITLREDSLTMHSHSQWNHHERALKGLTVKSSWNHSERTPRSHMTHTPRTDSWRTDTHMPHRESSPSTHTHTHSEILWLTVKSPCNHSGILWFTHDALLWLPVLFYDTHSQWNHSVKNRTHSEIPVSILGLTWISSDTHSWCTHSEVVCTHIRHSHTPSSTWRPHSIHMTHNHLRCNPMSLTPMNHSGITVRDDSYS